jgi:hypothetical protein
MRRWLQVSALVGASLLCAHLASAQSSDDAGGIPNYALSVGVGLVEPAGQTETYSTAALRIRLSRGEAGDQPRATQGYLEPEVGYWKSTDSRFKGSDTLVGINLVGAFPFAVAETFLGVGVGAHFIDRQILQSNANLHGSETKLGANAQFGVDLHLTPHFSLFGASRFDLVQGAKDSVQNKIYLGARLRF